MSSPNFFQRIFNNKESAVVEETVVADKDVSSVAASSVAQQETAGFEKSVMSAMSTPHQVVSTSHTVNNSGERTVVTTTSVTSHGAAMATSNANSTTISTGKVSVMYDQSRPIAPGRDVSGWTVVGKEQLEQRLVSVVERVDEDNVRIIGEKIIETEIQIPKRVIYEDIIEKIIVVPEKVIREETIQESHKVTEKIIEISKPIIVERLIEIPEIEYVERVVEVPQTVVEERVVEVEKVEYRDRITEVSKVIDREQVVEVPHVTYRDVVVERVEQEIEEREEIVEKVVAIPQYVDKIVERTINVPRTQIIEQLMPVPVEAELTYEYSVPKILPEYTKVKYPVYLPRFIEVPVARELMPAAMKAQSEDFLAQVTKLSGQTTSLCDVETLATAVMKADQQNQIKNLNFQEALTEAFNSM